MILVNFIGTRFLTASCTCSSRIFDTVLPKKWKYFSKLTNNPFFYLEVHINLNVQVADIAVIRLESEYTIHLFSLKETKLKGMVASFIP